MITAYLLSSDQDALLLAGDLGPAAIGTAIL